MNAPEPKDVTMQELHAIADAKEAREEQANLMTFADLIASQRTPINRAMRRAITKQRITCRGCKVAVKASNATAHLAKCVPAQKAVAAELLRRPGFAKVAAEYPEHTHDPSAG